MRSRGCGTVEFCTLDASPLALVLALLSDHSPEISTGQPSSQLCLSSHRAVQCVWSWGAPAE